MRPINTLKHIVDNQNTVPAGTQQTITIVNAVENAVSTGQSQCDIGSQVSSFFANVQVINSTNAVGAINNVYCYFILNPGDNIVSTSFPLVNEVGSSNFRKQIFHQEMAMLSDANDSIPITLFKGVLKIPRKGRRLGVADKIQMIVGTPVGGAEIDVCNQFIYKEVR